MWEDERTAGDIITNINDDIWITCHFLPANVALWSSHAICIACDKTSVRINKKNQR